MVACSTAPAPDIVKYNTKDVRRNTLTEQGKELSMRRAVVAAWVSLALAGGARAKDLVQVYDDAVRFDPQIHAADATRMAAREDSPPALAALLPPRSGHWAISRQRQVTNSVEPFPSPENAAELLPLPFDSTSWTD